MPRARAREREIESAVKRIKKKLRTEAPVKWISVWSLEAYAGYFYLFIPCFVSTFFADVAPSGQE